MYAQEHICWRSIGSQQTSNAVLETLSGLTPLEYMAKIWTSEPNRFIVGPMHQMPGLST